MNQTTRSFLMVALLFSMLAGVAGLRPGEVEEHGVVAPKIWLEHQPGKIAIDMVDGSNLSSVLAVQKILGEPLFTKDQARGWEEADVQDVEDAIEVLSADPRVEHVEPMTEYVAYSFPNDPLYEKQWHMRAMGAPAGWAHTPMGSGVVVAVLDTGVTQVEDLKGTTILEGESFIDSEPTTEDFNGHGTHCSGTIAQTTNNGVGVAGVAPKASILPVKVLSGSGSGSMYGVADGIYWAADNGADVISMSLGSSQPSAIIEEAVDYATKKGVLVIAAAGNSGREGVSYPGAFKNAIGVSATGPDGLLAPYSSWGKGVDISAPGGNKQIEGGGVWQNTLLGGDPDSENYYEFQGTSMATPHVAGAAAILLSTGLTPEATRAALLGRAKGNHEWDSKYGWGQLDLGASISSSSFGLTASLEQFLLTLILTSIIVVTTGTSWNFRARSVAIAALVGNGLWFLPLLPFTLPQPILMFTEGLLSWPRFWLPTPYSDFPLWLSCAVPALLTFTLAPNGKYRWAVLGVTAGIGSQLLTAAALGTMTVSWLPGIFGTIWLLANSAACIIFALSTVGVEKIQNEKKL